MSNACEFNVVVINMILYPFDRTPIPRYSFFEMLQKRLYHIYRDKKTNITIIS